MCASVTKWCQALSNRLFLRLNCAAIFFLWHKFSHISCHRVHCGWVNPCKTLLFAKRSISQQTRGIHPMPFQCWPIVFDACPTLKQHWVNAPCLLGYRLMSSEIETAPSWEGRDRYGAKNTSTCDQSREVARRRKG